MKIIFRVLTVSTCYLSMIMKTPALWWRESYLTPEPK